MKIKIFIKISICCNMFLVFYWYNKIKREELVEILLILLYFIVLMGDKMRVEIIMVLYEF